MTRRAKNKTSVFYLDLPSRFASFTLRSLLITLYCVELPLASLEPCTVVEVFQGRAGGYSLNSGESSQMRNEFRDKA